jgi:hypothetical protein
MSTPDPLKYRAEMIATQYMVANLYASMFGERFGVNAMTPCQQFSKSLKEHIATWTIPGLDPALSDHLSAEMQDSIHFQLSLIEELLSAKVEVYKEQQQAQPQTPPPGAPFRKY